MTLTSVTVTTGFSILNDEYTLLMDSGLVRQLHFKTEKEVLDWTAECGGVFG
jgi:hypothetical protein